MVRRHALGISALALLGCTSYVAAGCGGNTGTNNSPQNGNDGGTMMTEEGGASSSSSGGGGHDSGSTSDGGGGDASDGGHTPSGMYPAFPVDFGTVADQGGHVLAAPNIVTVTWSTDSSAASYNAFDDAIGASMYWHTLNSEYGVGPATSGGHVSITTPPPAMMTDQDVDTLVSTNVANGTWPAYTANTIYAVYVDPSTTLYFGAPDAGGSAACQSAGGYHTETQTGNYPYAVLPHCQGYQTGDIETAASHELNEASTDPHTNTAPAYVGFDNDHLSYEFFNGFQDELGDACEFYAPWVYYTDTETAFAYPVQRQWSNKSGTEGHNPCVPAPSGPFYNVTGFPNEQTTISVDMSPAGFGGMVTSKGYKGTLNQPLTIHLGAFSDAPAPAWDVNANVDMQFNFPDANGNPINNGTATVKLDKTSVVNGDMITVTITPTAWSSLGVVYVWFHNLTPGADMNNPPPHGDYPILISKN